MESCAILRKMKYKSIKVNKKIYDKIKSLSKEEKRTISGQLEYVLERYLKKGKKKGNG